MIRSKILIPCLIAMIAGGCGGSSTDNGGGGVVPPPRPTSAITTANEINGLPGQPASANMSARTGTATMTGLVATDLTSGGTGNRAILGESRLTVNFDTRSVTGSASNFAEVVSTTNSGQIAVSQWVQSMTGTLAQSGTIANGAGGSSMTLTTTGSLTGTMSINGQTVAGTYRVNANANTLDFLRKGTTTFAVGGVNPGQNSDLEVTFTPNGGAPIRVCIDNICPGSGTGLSAVHVLKLN